MRRGASSVLVAAVAAVAAIPVLAISGCVANAPVDSPPTTDRPGPTLPVFDDDRTDLDPGAPPESGPPGLVESFGASALQVSGEGCIRLQLGSGFVVGSQLVATNAHVIAGVENRFVIHAGVQLPADVVAFDPGTDIALLSVENLPAPPLPLADGAIDDEGLILGFGGAVEGLDADPFRINRLITANGENIYRDPGDVRRAAYLLAAEIEPGDSGGALVRADGTAVGMAFAASKRQTASYAVRASEIQALIDDPQINGDPARCAEG